MQVENFSCPGSLSVGSIRATRISTENLHGGECVPSTPPPSFYQLTSPSHPGVAEVRTEAEEGDPPLEGIQRKAPIGNRRDGGGEEVEDDVVDLGMRLGRSLLRSGIRAIQGAMEFLEGALPTDPESEQKQRTHLQVMLCVLLLLITGIFLLTRADTRHPHWDFYLPPTDI